MLPSRLHRSTSPNACKHARRLAKEHPFYVPSTNCDNVRIFEIHANECVSICTHFHVDLYDDGFKTAPMLLFFVASLCQTHPLSLSYILFRCVQSLSIALFISLASLLAGEETSHKHDAAGGKGEEEERVRNRILNVSDERFDEFDK